MTWIKFIDMEKVHAKIAVMTLIEYVLTFFYFNIIIYLFIYLFIYLSIYLFSDRTKNKITIIIIVCIYNLQGV